MYCGVCLYQISVFLFRYFLRQTFWWWAPRHGIVTIIDTWNTNYYPTGALQYGEYFLSVLTSQPWRWWMRYHELGCLIYNDKGLSNDPLCLSVWNSSYVITKLTPVLLKSEIYIGKFENAKHPFVKKNCYTSLCKLHNRSWWSAEQEKYWLITMLYNRRHNQITG